MIFTPGVTLKANYTNASPAGSAFAITSQFKYVTTSASLVYNLDFSNFSALPANGAADATGNYTISVGNTDSGYMSWVNTNSGIVRFNTSTQVSLVSNMPYIIGGPNYTTAAQSYTVFMAYRPITGGVQGRLLNTSNEATNDWLLGTYGSPPTDYMNVYYPNGTVNLSSDLADNNWHFIWGTWNAATGNLYLYIATNAAPVAVYKSLLGQTTGAANNSSRGFNQLRLFSRAASTEQQSADVGLIQVYNGELSLTDIQTLWNQYRKRFGY